jgi:circadian clock protein KaiC
MHLVQIYDLVKEHKPDIVVLDPITDFFAIGSSAEVKAAVTRIIDFLKTNQVTALFNSTTSEEDAVDYSIVGISSLIDAWISLRVLERNGERQRGLFILKARGLAHSDQIRSLRLSDDGIEIGEMHPAVHRAEPGPVPQAL